MSVMSTLKRIFPKLKREGIDYLVCSRCGAHAQLLLGGKYCTMCLLWMHPDERKRVHEKYKKKPTMDNEVMNEIDDLAVGGLNI